MSNQVIALCGGAVMLVLAFLRRGQKGANWFYAVLGVALLAIGALDMA